MGWNSPAVRGLANVKLKGKKSKMMSCGCCDAFNFKDLFEERLANEEIKQTLIDFYNREGQYHEPS